MTRLLARAEGLTVEVEGLLDTTATEPRDETTEFDLIQAPPVSEDTASSLRDAPRAISAEGETAVDAAPAAEAAVPSAAVDSPAAEAEQAQAVPVPQHASPSWISALLFEHKAPASPHAAPEQQQLSTSQAPSEAVTADVDTDSDVPPLVDDSADAPPPLIDDSAEGVGLPSSLGAAEGRDADLMTSAHHFSPAAESADAAESESSDATTEDESEVSADAPAPIADGQHSDEDDEVCSEESAPAVLPAGKLEVLIATQQCKAWLWAEQARCTRWQAAQRTTSPGCNLGASLHFGPALRLLELDNFLTAQLQTVASSRASSSSAVTLHLHRVHAHSMGLCGSLHEAWLALFLYHYHALTLIMLQALMRH